MKDLGGQLSLFAEEPTALKTVDEIYEEASQGLLELLQEDRRIERKPSGYHAEGLGIYLSMWANTKPEGGLMVIGIEDDGKMTGCSKISQNSLNNLERAGEVYCPDARYESKRISIQNYKGEPDFLLLIRIRYRSDKLVRNIKGEAYIRLGSSRKLLRQDEAREIEIDKGQVDLEQEPSGFEYPADFDMDLISQFTHGYRAVREIGQGLSDEEILQLNHLGKQNEKGFVANVACALLFANDPRTRFAGCKIRFLRFEGDHEGTGEKFNAVKDIPLDQGSLVRQILAAEKVMDAQIRDFSRLGPDGLFYTAPEYPKAAWYEAIVNACVHRSYNLRTMNVFIKMFDDRLVIESPGGFPPLVTCENIYDMSMPRNPYLMETMFYLKFVKGVHEGTRRMRDTMAAMNLPQPEFEQKEINHALVRVTLRNNIARRKVWIDKDASNIIGSAIFNSLDQNELRVINFVAENGTINVSQTQRLTGKSWEAAKNVLKKLHGKGILQNIRNPNLDRDPSAHYILNGEKGPGNKTAGA